MKWKWYHAVRLKKLADFLWQLENEKFNFGSWVFKEENGCGTVCCALGWMPKVDKRWEWVLHLKTIRYGSFAPPSGGETYFGITSDEFLGLFLPMGQKLYINYKNLDVNATPKQVANMYYKFIKRKEKIRLANKK